MEAKRAEPAVSEESVRSVQVERLRRFPMFEGMDAPALERISASATEFELPAGAVLYRRGDAGNGLFLVIEGMLKLCLQAPQGAERVIQMVEAGGCIGETALAGDSVHRLTAEVVVPARLVHFRRAMVRDELNRTPAFARWIIYSLTQRLCDVIHAFEDCTLRSGMERVAGYLIERLPRGAKEGSVQLRLDTKKGIIAAQLNLTQEHFSRILRELMTSGILEVRGSLLNISDVARLIHLVASGESRKPSRPSAAGRPKASVRSRRGR